MVRDESNRGLWAVAALGTFFTTLGAACYNENKEEPGPRWITYIETFGGAALALGLFCAGGLNYESTRSGRAYLPTESLTHSRDTF